MKFVNKVESDMKNGNAEHNLTQEKNYNSLNEFSNALNLQNQSLKQHVLGLIRKYYIISWAEFVKGAQFCKVGSRAKRYETGQERVGNCKKNGNKILFSGNFFTTCIQVDLQILNYNREKHSVSLLQNKATKDKIKQVETTTFLQQREIQDFRIFHLH